MELWLNDRNIWTTFKCVYDFSLLHLIIMPERMLVEDRKDARD